MAKSTVSKELAAQYPELEKYVGQTVDASIIKLAISNGLANKKDAGKTSARALVNKNPESKEVVSPITKNASPAKSAKKKIAKKSVSKKA